MNPIYRPTVPEILKRALSYDCNFDVAAEAKDIETIIWLHSNSYYCGKKYSYKVIDFAASNGDVDMVLWLYNNGYMNNNYSEDAVVGAAGTGCIILLELFYSISPEYGFNSSAFDASILSGNLNTVKWFSLCTKVKFTLYGLIMGVISGYLDILKYLLINNRSIFSLNSKMLLNYAGFCCQKNVVKWLKKVL